MSNVASALVATVIFASSTLSAFSQELRDTARLGVVGDTGLRVIKTEATAARLKPVAIVKIYFAVWDAIAASIWAFTAAMLKLAPFCMGGKSMKLWAALPTSCWTNTKRQNS